jgi:hypothetical protein
MRAIQNSARNSDKLASMGERSPSQNPQKHYGQRW